MNKYVYIAISVLTYQCRVITCITMRRSLRPFISRNVIVGWAGELTQSSWRGAGVHSCKTMMMNSSSRETITSFRLVLILIILILSLGLRSLATSLAVSDSLVIIWANFSASCFVIEGWRRSTWPSVLQITKPSTPFWDLIRSNDSSTADWTGKIWS